MVVEARRGEGDARLVTDVALPLALSQTRAEALAASLLGFAGRSISAEVSAGPALSMLETGDRVRINGEAVWRIEAIADEGIARRLTLAEAVAAPGRVRSLGPVSLPPQAPVYPEADLVVIDAPALVGVAGEGPLVAAQAEPWPGTLSVRAGITADALRERARLDRPAVIGRLLAPVADGPPGRWDRSARLDVQADASAFASLAEGAVLAGGNAALLETDAGWELIQFREADLTGPGTWRLRGLLRGQGGSVSGAAEAGARLVLLDEAVQRADLPAMELGWS